MIDPQMLDFVRCPVTHQSLAVMPGDGLQKLNRLVRQGELKSRDDSLVAAELTEALVTEDGKTAYPVVDGFPMMMEEHGIPLSQLDASK
ncbi:MAG TPA: Trm112 family protein [Gammaproteobacteria bacterium]